MDFLSFCRSFSWSIPGIVDGILKRGIAPEKVASIPNGCDLDIFASEHQPWRPEGVKETDLMAILQGRMA